MKQIGLFAGIGGFELAAKIMGWETIAWCEKDPFCRRVLTYHFPNAEKYADIKTADFSALSGKVDILTGGFPCQPYSTAGKRLGSEDYRHLWPEMLRVIRQTSPRWVVGENVGGLISWNGGLVFEQVHTDLEAEGYEVQAFVLPACGVDAPHRRDRVWFVARRTAADTNYNGSHGPENRQGVGSGNDSDTARPNKAVKLARCSVSDAWPIADADGNGYQLRRQDRPAPAAGESIEQEWQRIWPNVGRACEPCITTDADSAGCGQQHVPCQPGWQGFGYWCGNEGIAAYAESADGKLAGHTRGWRDGFADGGFAAVPDWRKFPTQSPVCRRDDGFPGGLVGITIPGHRRESIKAYGNAVVPQVVLQIYKAIEQFENLNT